MQVLHVFATSTIGVFLHVALTVALFALVVWTVRKTASDQQNLIRENALLDREVGDLTDRLTRLSDGQRQHHEVLCKIGDHIEDIAALVPQDFDSLRCQQAVVEGDGPIIYLDELADTGDHDTHEDRIEPDLLMPVSAVVADIAGQRAVRNAPLDDKPKDESDPLTRALHLSKSSSR